MNLFSKPFIATLGFLTAYGAIQPTATTASEQQREQKISRLNVKQFGAKGDGITDDTEALGTLVAHNRSAILYFPAGIYRLHNYGVDRSGLNFSQFKGQVILEQGAVLSCDTLSRQSGQCVLVKNSEGARFTNLSVTYRDLSVLPLKRVDAVANALLVQDSRDITFDDLTIVGSSGSGAWNTDSVDILYAGTTRISRTTADGLHFENVGGSVVENLITDETGDDGIGVTNINQVQPKCGLLVKKSEIHNSHSRGIAVAGACGVRFTDVHIDGTTNSGIAVIQDSSIQSRVSTNIEFVKAVVTNVGFLRGIDGNHYCLDIGRSTSVSAQSIRCDRIADSGVSIYNMASHIRLEGVEVRRTQNNGFQIDDSSDVELIDDFVSQANNSGFEMHHSNRLSLLRCGAEQTGGYGFFHSSDSSVVERSLVARNTALAKNNGRAWWVEKMTGHLSVDGLLVVDDQPAATGITVGEADRDFAAVDVRRIVFRLKSGSPVIQKNNGMSVFTPDTR